MNLQQVIADAKFKRMYWERLNPTQRLSYVLTIIKEQQEGTKQLLELASSLAPAHVAFKSEEEKHLQEVMDQGQVNGETDGPVLE